MRKWNKMNEMKKSYRNADATRKYAHIGMKVKRLLAIGVRTSATE